jgi:hypothetical protein
MKRGERGCGIKIWQTYKMNDYRISGGKGGKEEGGEGEERGWG